MLLSSWLNAALSRLRGARQRISVRSRRGVVSGTSLSAALSSHAVVAPLEQLEDRTLLSHDPIVAGVDGIFVLEPGTNTSGESIAPFQFSDTDRWSSTTTNGSGLTQGQPTTLTWGIVLDGATIEPQITGESSATSSLIAFFDSLSAYLPVTGGSDLTQRNWYPIFSNSFDRIAALSGVDFVDQAITTSQTIPTTGGSASTPDILIGGHSIDGQSGGNILAYNFFPNVGDMVIDTDNLTFFNDTSLNSVGPRNVIMHEAGHGLGLSHVESSDANFLMEPFITTAFDGPQLDDILALQRGYGDVLEKSGGNDTSVTATNLGTITSGSTVSRGTLGSTTVVAASATDFVSIDDESDVDFFKFTVTAASTVTLTLTPRGTTYMQGPQTDPATPQTSFNSAAQSDLTLMLDTNGTSPLTTANATGLGGIEAISNFYVGAAGTYFARITGATTDKIQLYGLDVAVSAGTAPTTTLSLDASNNLVLTDTLARSDTLTIKSDTTNNRFVVSDPGATFSTGIANASGNGTNTLLIPFASVAGTQIFVNADGGNDSLTIDLSLGNLSKTITYDGGTQTSSDSLTVTGGSTFATVTHTFTSNSAGTIAVTGNSLISYLGLEPVTDNLSATNRVFTFNGGAETITLTDAAGANMTIDSTLGESVTFANPTSSLTINSGTGDDTVNAQGVDAAYAGNLTINGDDGVDAVNFQTSATNLGSGSLSVTADTIALNVAVTAAGASLSATNGVTVSDVLTTGAGGLNVNADSDADGTGAFTISTATLGAFTQQAQLIASDGAIGDSFGISVSMSGDTVVVGAIFDKVGANNAQGSAYVFTRSGSTWTQQAQLTASDGGPFDFFGASVAIDGDTVVVGAWQDTVGSNFFQGSAYVFTRSGSTWTQQAQLVASDGAGDDHFGISVAVSGNTAVVGAYNDDVGANGDQGSAYVFTRSGSTWTQQAQLTASDGASNDLFGQSVGISGDTAVVGAYHDDVGSSVDQGSAYVFTRSGTTWTQQAQLTASSTFEFGVSVAVSGETVVTGAQFGDANDFGAAYVFTRNGSSWSQQAQLTASDGAQNDFFGFSVAISGDTAIVGAFQDDVGANSNQGSAYPFARSGSTWNQQATLIASDGAALDLFGDSVSVSGNSVVVGARSDDVGSNGNQGSAYVFAQQAGSSGGSIVAGSGNVSIAAASLTLSGAITGTGTLTLIPSTAAATIGIGGGAGTYNLDDSELAQLANGFGSITVGDATNGTGAVIITSSTFNDPITVVGGSISVTEMNAGTNAVKLTARTGAITDGGDAGTDLTGSSLVATSSSGVGASGDVLSTVVSNLEAVGGTGGVFVSNTGNLTIGGIGATVGISASGGNVSIAAASSMTVSEAVTVTGSGTILLDAQGGDTGDLIINAALTSASGAITLQADDDITSNTSGTLTTASGAVTITADDDGTASGTITYTAAINHGSTGSTWSLADTDGSMSAVLSGSGGLTKNGNGTLTLSGTSANTFTGTTTVNAGTLQLSKTAGLNAIAGPLTIGNGSGTDTVKLINANQVPDATDVTIAIGGVLDLNGKAEDIDGLNGTGSVTSGAAGSITFGIGSANDATPSFSGVIQNGSGTVGLRKFGSGTQTLGGANTFTGTTLLSGGRLNVNGSTASGSAVTVSSGTTLGGTGTVAGTVSVQSGGVLAPGLSPGLLNSGSVTFASSSTFAVEIAGDDGAGAADGHDQLNVTGTVSLGNATLSLNTTGLTAAEVPDGQQFVIINNDSTEAITGTFNGFAETATVLSNVASSGRDLQISYVGGTDGNDVVLTVITIETSITLSSNNLVISDVNGGASNDTLTIKSDTTNSKFIISDPNQKFSTSISGATGSGTNTVTIPFASVSGTQIMVNTLAGNDSLTIDLSLGNFSKTITYDGGNPTTGPADSLTLTGGTFATVTHTLTSASAGTIAVTGNSTISYLGLEPVFDNLSATDRVFTFTGGTETITVTDGTAADGKTMIDSDLSESVYFVNPTGSLTINAGTGADILTVTSVDAAYNVDLTINGDAGNDTVNLNGDITFASGESLNVNLTNDASGGDVDAINVGASANLITSGSGSIALQSSSAITAASGSSLETVNGGITVAANAAGTTNGTFDGVTLTGTSVTTSGSGNISLTGHGGVQAGPGSSGIRVQTSSTVQSTLTGATAGSVTLTGTGHGASLSRGIILVSTSLVTSVSGAIAITGQGSTTATADSNYGIQIAGGGDITSTGTGANAATIILSGTGGVGTGSNLGFFTSGSGSNITTVDGVLSIIGQGGSSATGSAQEGVVIWTNALVESTGSGTVTITGTAGQGTFTNRGIDLQDSSIVRSTGSGDILMVGTANTASADSSAFGLFLDSGALVTTTGTGNLTLRGIGGGTSGSSNSGVKIGASTPAASVSSTNSGSITVQGKAGIGSTSFGILMEFAGSSITSSGTGSVTLAADNIVLTSGTTIAAGSNIVTLRPATTSDIATDDNGDTINLGSTSDVSGSSNNLELSDAELDLITAGTIIVGDTSSGTITVSSNLTQPAKNLTLITGAGVTGSANIINGSPTATTVTINQAGNSTYSGQLGGPSGGTANDKKLSFVKQGVGTLTLSTANTFTGTTTINNGILALSGSGNPNNRTSSTIVINSNGVLRLDSPNVIPDAAAMTIDGGTWNLQDHREFIGSLALQNAASVTAASGGWFIVNGTSPGNINTAGTGNAGTISADMAIASSSGIHTGNRTQTFDIGTGATLAISGAIADSREGGGVGSLIKTGSGTLTLSGANTYTGATTVSTGTLLVNGSLANGAATTDVTVASGATLGGTGTINGGTSVSGKLAPGNSPGILNNVGNFAFANNSTFEVEIGGTTAGNAVTNHDQLNVTGTVTIGSTVTLSTLGFNGFVPVAGNTFTIIKNDGTDLISGTFNGLAEGATISNFLGSGLNATITYVANTDMASVGNDVVLSVAERETSVVLDGSNNLVITDTNGGTSNDTLTLSINGSNVRVNDPSNTLQAGAGTTQVDLNTVDVPLASILGNIQVNTLAGNDSLTINYSAGNFPNAIVYNGGTQTTGDLLTLSGGSFATGTHTLTGAGTGTVDFTGNGQLSYLGLEPRSDNITVVDTASVAQRVFTFTAGAETISINDTGGANMMIDSTLTESVIFSLPTDSLTVNAGSGADTVNFDSRDLNGPFTRDVTIDGGDGADTINFNDDLVFASGENLLVTGEATVIAANAQLETQGAGQITFITDSFTLPTTANVFSTSTLTIKPQTAGTAIDLGGSDAPGVLGLTDAELDHTEGALLIGDTSTGQLIVSAAISRTTAALTLTTGGNNSLTFSGATATLEFGSRAVTIALNNSGTGAVISGGETTDITAGDLVITAGSGGIGASGNPLTTTVLTLLTDTDDTNDGAQFLSEFDTLDTTGLRTGTAALQLDGGTFARMAPTTNIISDTADVTISAGATYDTTGGDETIDGLSGSGTFTGSGATLTVGFNNATSTFAGVISGGGMKLIKTGSGTFALTGANTYTGETTINAGTLLLNGSLVNGGPNPDVIVNSGATFGGTGTTPGSVQVNAGGIVAPGTSPGILNTGSITFASTSTFAVEIVGNGGVGNSNGHDQLNVTGTVSLGGATLTLNTTGLTAAEVPFDQTFVIVNNDSTEAVSGTFSGYTSGATVVANVAGSGRDLTITYSGGTDNNDVVLSVTEADTVITLDGSNNLVITDGRGGNSNDLLTIKSDTTNSVFIISNPNLTLSTYISGAMGSGTNIVTIPFASVGGSQIFVNTLAGNDSLTIDLSAGNFPKSITYDGGNPTTGPADSLTLTGGATFATVTHTLTSASAGTINVTGNSQFSYLGLEPVFDNLNATARVFSFNGGAESITVTDGTASDGKTMIDSDLGESVYFANPSGSLTINAGTGADSVTLTSVDAGFNVDLTINGDADSDTVNLNVDSLTFAGGESLIVNAESVTTGASADLTTSGAGVITITADDVALHATSTLVSASTITLKPQTASRPIDLGTETTSQLSLTDAELDRLTTSTLRIGSSGSGTITLSAAIDTLNTNRLSLITGAAIMQTSMGLGLTESELAVEAVTGVTLTNTSNDVGTLAIHTTTGLINFIDAAGLIIGSVDGVLGLSAEDTVNPGSIALTINSGNVTVQNTLASNDVFGTGSITFTLSVSEAFFTITAGADVESTGGFHGYHADNLDIAGTITGTGQLVEFTSSAAFKPINLGAVGDAIANTVELSDAELDNVTAGTLQIGAATSTIDVTAAIDLTDGPNIPTTILFASGGVLGSGGNVLKSNALSIQTVSMTGGIGVSGDPFAFDATTLTTNSNGFPDSHQFLNESNSVTIATNDLDAGDAAITLTGGTFLTSSLGSILSAVTVASGATLGGTGTTAAITTQSGGTVAPGNSPGILNSGNVSLVSGSNFNVEIDGTAGAGVVSGHDQLNVTGTVNLGGANLVITLGYTPANGDTFKIIDNNDSDAVTETFMVGGNSIADGGTFVVSGTTFVIDYTSGTNSNDVTLTAQNNTLTTTIVGNDLVIEDIDGTGKNNLLSVSRSGANLIISDANEAFATVIAGAMLSNGNKTVSVPASALGAGGKIIVKGQGGSDNLSVDVSTDLGFDVDYQGGSGASDSLTLAADTVASVTHVFTDANSGSVTIVDGGTRVITYSGLEPITDNLIATDRVFTFNAASEIIALTTGTTLHNKIDSDFGESVEFDNPSGSLTINAGDGTDTVNITSVHASFRAALTINGDNASDTVNLNTPLLLGSTTSTGNLAVTAEAINLNAASIATDGDTTNNDAGAVTLNGEIRLDRSVGMDTDATVTDGSVQFNGTVSAGHFYQYVAGSVNFGAAEAGAEAATLNGMPGYLATPQSPAENAVINGVRLAGAGQTFLGGSDATVEGEWRWIGGPQEGQQFSTNAPASVNGQYINWAPTEPNSATEDAMEMVSSGQWNDRTVATSLNGYVVEFGGSQVLTLTAGAGNVTFTGTVGANFTELGSILANSANNVDFQQAVSVVNGITQSAGTGTTTLNGATVGIVGATVLGNLNITTTTVNVNSGVNQANGAIDITADDVAIAGGASLTTTETTTIKPQSANRPINLGNEIGGSLSLTDTELDRVTAGTLVIGNSSSGAITVSAAITRSADTDLQLLSGAAINFTTGSLASAGGDVLLNPGTSVSPATSGSDVNAGTGTLTFGTNDDLAIVINGTTVDSDYQQLHVTGVVTLTGVDLALSGTHTPLAAQTFTIVENDDSDAIVGMFNGLTEGATISSFLGSALSATISYVGGDGNDVVLTVSAASTPTLSISDVMVAEGQSGTTTFTFNVTLSAATAASFRVPFQTMDGTATTADHDYVPLNSNGNLVIGAFDATRGGTYGLFDGSGAAAMRAQILANFPGATILGTSTLTSAFLSTVNVVWLNSVSSDFTVTSALSPAEQAALQSFVTAGGSAILFGENESFDDSTLLSPFGLNTTGTTVGVTSGMITNTTHPVTQGPFGNVNTIVSNYPGNLTTLGSAISLGTWNSTGQSALAVLTSGAGKVVALTDVNLYADRLGAADNSKLLLNTLAFARPASALQFAGTAGEVQQIQVFVNGDPTVEPDELFSVVLGSVIGTNDVTITDGTGVGTIINDDFAPVVNDQNFSINENSPNNSVVGTVVATDPGDVLTYSIFSGNTNGAFQINSSTGQLTVLNSAALDFETTPTFNLTVKVQDSGLLSNMAVITINLNNLQSTLSINDVSQAEGNSGTTPMTFTVTLSDTTGSSFRVPFQTQNGTATTANNDYLPLTSSSSLVIGAFNSVRGGTYGLFDGAGAAAMRAQILANFPGATILGTDTLTSTFLSMVNVVWLNSVSSDLTVTSPLSLTEQAALQSFVTAGNGAIVFGENADFDDSTLLSPFGLTTTGTTVSITSGMITNTMHPVTQGPFGNVSMISSNYPGNLTGLGNAVSLGTWNSSGLSALAALNYGAGKVVALTDVNFYADRLNQAGNQNRQLLLNALAFAQPASHLQFAGTAGETHTLQVTINGDGQFEPNENFNVLLTSIIGSNDVSILKGTGIGTIQNDDVMMALQISNALVSERTGPSNTATFNVTMSSPSTQPVSVTFSTSSVGSGEATRTPTASATAGRDFQARSGTLRFAPGQLSQTISVPVLDDMLHENEEVFYVQLGSAIGATIADGSGQATIRDNDAGPRLNINDVTVTERDTTTVNATFTVRLTAVSAVPVTVDFATSGDTATEGTDYQESHGSITFNPGETTKTITVVTNGDLLHEANEVFFVNLTNSMQAAILDGQGRGTLRNNDQAPRLSIGDVRVIEGETAVFTVSLSAPSGQAVTVNYATANGTAVAGREFAATTGTLTFAAGETTKTIRVAIAPNAILSSSRSFKVNLSHAVNALFSDSQALATILDSGH